MSGASQGLEPWPLRLPNFKFDMVYSTESKCEAAITLPKPPTTGADTITMHDRISLLDIKTNTFKVLYAAESKEEAGEQRTELQVDKNFCSP